MRLARKKRLYLVLLVVIGVGAGVALALNAFNRNVMYYYSPSKVLAGEASPNHAFRLGGLVTKGSLSRLKNGLTVHFDVTDLKKTVSIEYTGILPDLFREGQGIVAHGKLRNDGVFVADEVLAKHDEKYMPPEVAASLKEAQNEGAAASGTKGATTP